MIRRMILTLAALTCLTPLSSAQQPTYVGIPSVTFFAAAQQEDEWCWAASIQMILNHYEIPLSQQEIVTRTYGALVNQPGTDQQISANLNGWAVTVQGKHVTVRSWTKAGPPAPLVLLQELSRGHPILLTFSPNGPNSGHAVVITAASYVQTPQGPIITSLVLRDPFPTQQNIANSGRVELMGPQLASFIPLVRGHWIVWVE